jgi:hypothetical protein
MIGLKFVSSGLGCDLGAEWSVCIIGALVFHKRCMLRPEVCLGRTGVYMGLCLSLDIVYGCLEEYPKSNLHMCFCYLSCFNS